MGGRMTARPEGAAMAPDDASFWQRQRALGAYLWRRQWAFAIDCVVLEIVKVAVQLLFWSVEQFGILPQALALQPGPFTRNPRFLSAIETMLFITVPGPAGLAALIALGVGIVYFTLCESSPTQATLGKLWTDLKVTDRHGQRPSFGQALLRSLIKVGSVLPLALGYVPAMPLVLLILLFLPLALLHLLPLLTPLRQTLHDLLSGTLVVVHESATALPGDSQAQAAVVATSSDDVKQATHDA
jgi:uncharacterized RDD family membrane protein YckC